MMPAESGVAGRVLIVDDEEAIVFGLTRTLERRGYQMAAASNAAEGLLAAENFGPDLVLLDIRLPDAGGLSLVRSLRRGPTRPAVVVMTGFASEETAKGALREGALLVIGKPIDMDQLLTLISEIRGLAHARAKRALFLGERDGLFLAFLREGSSAAATALRTEVEQVARGNGPHLVIGEPGTGRQLIARAIHLWGPHRNGPFVELDSRTLTAERVQAARGSAAEGTLFGRGRSVMEYFPEFTGDAVAENSSAPASAPRIAVALSSPFGSGAALVKDLRAVFPRWVEIPPMRARSEDAPMLLGLLLGEAAAAIGRPAPPISLAGRSVVERHDWPGNLDEMRLVADRALLLFGAGPLGTDELSALIGL